MYSILVSRVAPNGFGEFPTWLITTFRGECNVYIYIYCNVCECNRISVSNFRVSLITLYVLAHEMRRLRRTTTWFTVFPRPSAENKIKWKPHRVCARDYRPLYDIRSAKRLRHMTKSVFEVFYCFFFRLSFSIPGKQKRGQVDWLITCRNVVVL